MDMLSKQNDSDALKERSENNLLLGSLFFPNSFRKYFWVVAQVKDFD